LKQSHKVIVLIFFILLIDQALKIWIKTHMSYGEEIKILGLNWALIHFVENNGMAFGISLGGDHGKLALSLFRIVAVFFLGYYIRVLIRSGASFGLLCCFALILAGALGNILDSAFYGLIFSETPFHSGGVATLFPEGEGYAGFLYGKVVDMFYFPILKGTFPDWLPFWGGERYLFFRPVFNIADTSITTGVISLLVFHRSFFSGSTKNELENVPVQIEENESLSSHASENSAATSGEAESPEVEVNPPSEEQR